MKRTILCLFAVLALGSQAKAWNCTTPGYSRVDVGTTAPVGSTPGDGPDQWYKGTDAANPNDYYVCYKNGIPPTPPTPPTSTPSTQSQSQNQNQTSTSSANSNSNATGGNASATGGSSKSTSTATGGAGGNATGGNATGGSVSGSGNSTVDVKNTIKNTNTSTSSVSASGNSSNQNTLNGGSQTQTANAANNGNGSNNASYNSETNVAATKIPVEQAFAYAAQPTVNCAATFGAGGQGAAFGFSISGTKVDKNCADLEAARKAPNRLTYCKVYIKNKFVHDAGVSLEDCLLMDAVAPPAPVVVPVAPQPTVIVLPAPVAQVVPQPEPRVIVTARQTFGLGSCRMTGGVLTNVCKRFLDDAILRLNSNPDAQLKLTGPVEGGKAALYVSSRGVDASRVSETFSDDQNETLTLQLTWTENIK